MNALYGGGSRLAVVETSWTPECRCAAMPAWRLKVMDDVDHMSWP
jgi:hypothetical protein